MSFCQNCGTKLPEGAAFCPGCGAAVPGQTEQQQIVPGQAEERQTVPGQTEEQQMVREEELEQPYTFESVKSPKKKKGRAGKIVLLIVVVLVIILFAAAMGGKSRKNTDTSEAAVTEEMTDEAANDAMDDSEDAQTDTPVSEEETANVEDSSTESEVTEVQVGNLIFGIPAYYGEGEHEENDDGTNMYMYSYDMSDTGAAIVLISYPASGVNKTRFREGKDAFREMALEGFKTDENVDVLEEKETEYMNMPAYSYTLHGPVEGLDATVKEEFFIDEENEMFYAIVFIKGEGMPDDIEDDYESMLKNARKADGNKEENADNSSAGVDPDLKETLDAYERMMNEYCDFMEKYENADSSDVFSMLGDYSKMMSEYADAMDKLNELDTSKMSTADYKYYLDVTTRVSKRLLDVAS